MPMKRTLVVAGLVVAVVAAAALGMGGRAMWQAYRARRHITQAAAREPGALADWRAAYGDPDTLLAELPDAGDNASAVQLVTLARAIDVDFSNSTSAPSSWRAIEDYIQEEAKKDGAATGALPDEARRYLDAHRTGLTAIASFLAASDAPAWRRTVSAGLNGPLPNFLVLRGLSSALTAEAIVQYGGGHGDAAERALVASWQLNVSVRDRVEVISQLIAQAIAGINVGIIRRMTIEPAAWRTRFAAHNYQDSLMRALVGDNSDLVRASRADYLDSMRTQLAIVRAMPSTVPVGKEAGVDASEAEMVTPGLAMARVMQPGAARAWVNAGRLMALIEACDRALQKR